MHHTPRSFSLFLLIAMSLSAAVFTSGCFDNGYNHLKFDTKGKLRESWKINVNQAMSNSSRKGVLIFLSDGSLLTIDESKLTADPNSAIAIGSAIAEGIRAYNGTDAVKAATAGNTVTSTTSTDSQVTDANDNN